MFLEGVVRAGADCGKMGRSCRGDYPPRVPLLALEPAARGPVLPFASDHTQASLSILQFSLVLSDDLRQGWLCDKRHLLAHGKADGQKCKHKKGFNRAFHALTVLLAV